MLEPADTNIELDHARRCTPTRRGAATTAALRLVSRGGGAAILLVLVACVVLAAIVYPQFLTGTNLENVLRQSVPLALVAIGMTLVLIVGEIDVSVGATYGVAGLVFAGLSLHTSLAVSLAGAIGTGAGVGILNALLVTGLGLSSFMVTFATSLLILGVGLLYSNAAITVTSESVLALGSPSVFGLPADVVGTGLVAAVVGTVLAKTAYGRAVYAVGGNREAARLAGMRVNVLKASTFVLVGITSALAGIVTVARSATGNVNSGSTIALYAIATVVLGGTSIWGGRGAVWRTIVGVLILGVLGNVFDGLSLPTSAQDVVTGAAVVLALAFQSRAGGRRQ